MAEECCHLQATKHWGMKFAQPSQSQDTKSMKLEHPEVMHLLDKQCPELIAQGKLIGFVDAAHHANELDEMQSTTGCMFAH